jgi:L-rhamnose mutarotase
MQRFAWILTVKEGKEQEYVQIHSRVWPELISASKEAGLRNHTTFVSGRTVIAYLEADDPQAAMSRLMKIDVKKRWDHMMSEILESSNTLDFKEVFHFD